MRIRDMLHLEVGDKIIKTKEHCLGENGLGSTQTYEGKETIHTVVSKNVNSINISNSKSGKIDNSSIIYFYELYKGKK